MGFEDDSYQEREEPVNINYQSSSPIAANQLGQTNNPLFTSPLQPILERNQFITPVSTEEKTEMEAAPPMSPLPEHIALNLQGNTEQPTKEYVDVESLLGNFQAFQPIIPVQEQEKEEQYFSPISEEVLNTPRLKSPLFRQHQRLQSLLVNAQDHFTKGSSGEGVFAIQQALKKLYPQATIGQYGIYGKQTITLVKKFQQEEGLGNDGNFGRQTLLALDKYSFPKVVINRHYVNKNQTTHAHVRGTGNFKKKIIS